MLPTRSPLLLAPGPPSAELDVPVMAEVMLLPTMKSLVAVPSRPYDLLDGGEIGKEERLMMRYLVNRFCSGAYVCYGREGGGQVSG